MRLLRRIRRRTLEPVTGVTTAQTLRVLTVLGLVCLPSVAGENRATLERATEPIDGPDLVTAERVARYLDRKRVEYNIPGLSWVVVRQGEVVAAGGLGMASPEFSVPAEENTVYPISSSSKMFAAVAAMRLVEQGRLSLDTSTRDLVPELPESWQAIRVEHLLNHTSGIDDFYRNPKSGFEELTRDERNALGALDALGFSFPFPLLSTPGEKWSYSLAGYVLLGRVLETASGLPYPELVRREILEPLGLASTFGGTETLVVGRSPVLYAWDGDRIMNHEVHFDRYSYPAGGLNASALEVARFLSALQGGQLLSPKSLQRLWTPVTLGDGSIFPYGLGFGVGEYRGHRRVGHEGGGQSWNAHFPDLGLTIVVIANLSGARADEVVTEIADLYLEGN